MSKHANHKSTNVILSIQESNTGITLIEALLRFLNKYYYVLLGLS